MRLGETSLYDLEYLPTARRDMVDIVGYISRELHNPAAAQQLAAELIEAAEQLREFPYAAPAYIPLRPLQREYRKLLVRNYLMFDWVNENQKQITVARGIYARRDHGALLD